MTTQRQCQYCGKPIDHLRANARYCSDKCRVYANRNKSDIKNVTVKPIKPLMRYHGGKWLLAPWIIKHLPAHRIYVEPFGGVASVLLLKDRSFSEVYNDLDGEIVNLFRILRTRYQELEYALKNTPYAREEFEEAFEPTDCPVERARRILIRSWQGHSSVGAHRKTGFRSNIRYMRSSPAQDWHRLIDHLYLVRNRMMGVSIEHRPAVDVIQGHDSKETVFYVDPPYPHSTRLQKVYRHEMTNNDHRALATCLHSVEGMVVISGYACELYDIELYSDWQRLEHEAFSDRHQERTEILWINSAAQEALDRSTNPLGLNFA